MLKSSTDERKDGDMHPVEKLIEKLRGLKNGKQETFTVKEGEIDALWISRIRREFPGSLRIMEYSAQTIVVKKNSTSKVEIRRRE